MYGLVGPMEVEVNLYALQGRRRGGDDPARHVHATIDHFLIKITAEVNASGSSLHEFAMTPIDLEAVNMTLPELNATRERTARSDVREILQRIFSTTGFLMERFRKFATEAVTIRSR
ncbi:unnamed protein product [Darwinula stevensoni]|uniref:Uncharacterized protein n=1 Tax=Darwinula stevensoni TaxID=69355 RepID=A0A7R9FTM8_9CRUS|nr:unnamed protein product [Darwinula stevensoni]CAG0905880.1 unnamed protein product [Darwinula stevensoni]